MEYATGDAQKRTCPARITIEGNDLKQQTAPHNHAVNIVDPGEGNSEKHEKRALSYTPVHVQIEIDLNS